MQRLKDLRTKLGITQKELAKRLGTTQQTIARWESEQTAIPTAMLKDLAALFGTSTDQLLGVESPRVKRKSAQQMHPDLHDHPWGTLEVQFAFGSRLYPIDHNAHDFLVSFLDDENVLDGLQGWEHFDALDNRCVFVNYAAVRELRFSTRDAEPMPYYASPEVYTKLTEASLSGADVAKLIRELLTDSKGGRKQHETIQEALSSVLVVSTDGTTCTLSLNDALGGQLARFDKMCHKIGANAFLSFPEDSGKLRILNLSTVAAIEIPRQMYYARYFDPEVDR